MGEDDVDIVALKLPASIADINSILSLKLLHQGTHLPANDHRRTSQLDLIEFLHNDSFHLLNFCPWDPRSSQHLQYPRAQNLRATALKMTHFFSRSSLKPSAIRIQLSPNSSSSVVRFPFVNFDTSCSCSSTSLPFRIVSLSTP